MTGADFAALVQDYGLWIIAPVALVEGPVISILSGWLARMGMIGLPKLYLCLVLADLAGDVVLYAVGRYGRGRAAFWQASPRFRKGLARGLRAFRARGGRILVLGKITHSAGFAVLLAAGLARMPFGRFLVLNLAATMAKTALFMAAGWIFGEVAMQAESWLPLIGLAALVVLVPLLFLHRPRKRSEA